MKQNSNWPQERLGGRGKSEGQRVERKHGGGKQQSERTVAGGGQLFLHTPKLQH